MPIKPGVLLVNLGTPSSPRPKDVYKYLIEFLTDGRVIDYSWLSRQLLVRGLIVPLRYRKSAKLYQQIWTAEGSPLLTHGVRLKKCLQENLEDGFHVELAMRYQQPSIKNGIKKLLDLGVQHIIVLPLFPQYASATTGSVHECVMKELSKSLTIPKLTFISQYATHSGYIGTICAIAETYPLEEYDHILFSFHGLPERHLRNADKQQCCLKTKSCCAIYGKQNGFCYSAQCYATARAIAEKLNLSNDRYSISFQSRLGREPWMQPYTSETLEKLAAQGKKKVLVFSPSFVADCLETICEIGIEYSEEFKKAGGEKLDLVRSLNDHPLWVDALREIILENK